MKMFALAILRLYKRWISPALLPSCRYVPTCSEYAEEAIDRYGIFRGGLMAAWRLLRCHPFVKGGYDPVVAPYSNESLVSRFRWAVSHGTTARGQGDHSNLRTANSERRTAGY